VRDRFKIIPECVRETDLHPDPSAAVLRTLNFPRAALGHGEEEEELTLSEFSLFFSGRHHFFLLTKKSSPALVILRGCFFSIRSLTPACVSTLLTSSSLLTVVFTASAKISFFFYSLQGKGNVASTPLFLFSLKPRISSCVFDQEEGRWSPSLALFSVHPFTPVSRLTNFRSVRSRSISRGIFHADRPGRECVHENRSDGCRDGGSRQGNRGNGEGGRVTSARGSRARRGCEGRCAVGGRNRKTGVDCPCALGWLLERWHGDAYLRLPGVPLMRPCRDLGTRDQPWERDVVPRRNKMISDGDTHPSRLNSIRSEKMRHRYTLKVTTSICCSFNKSKLWNQDFLK